MQNTFELEVITMKNMFIIFILLIFASVVSFGNDTVKLAIGEWAPYTSEKDPKGKIAEAIVIEAFKLENIDVEFEYFPWKRSYAYVKSGKSVGTFPWYSSEERREDFIINKEAVVKANSYFFHLKSTDFNWETYEDLKKYRVGVTLGYIDAQELPKVGVPVEIATKDELNFKKLLIGRIAFSKIQTCDNVRAGAFF